MACILFCLRRCRRVLSVDAQHAAVVHCVHLGRVHVEDNLPICVCDVGNATEMRRAVKRAQLVVPSRMSSHRKENR